MFSFIIFEDKYDNIIEVISKHRHNSNLRKYSLNGDSRLKPAAQSEQKSSCG